MKPITTDINNLPSEPPAGLCLSTGVSGLPERLLVDLAPASQLAIFAHQLQKFELPPEKYRLAYLRLLQNQLSTPKLPKKTLDRFPLTVLSKLATQLAVDSCQSPRRFSHDVLLTFLLAWQDFCEFNLVELVSADIALLAEEDNTRLHSYYYQPPYKTESLHHILPAHGFSSQWLQDIEPQENTHPENPLKLYWLTRQLAHVLPWRALLGENSEALQHLSMLTQQLNQTNPTFLKTLEACQNEADLFHAFSGETLLTALAGLNDFHKTMILKRPYQKIILVEGVTESTLLPLFAAQYLQKKIGHLHALNGIHLIPAGGKNQMLALYKQLSRILKIPIFVLLDSDADRAYQQLSSLCRKGDQIYKIENGEFEDLYSTELLLETINRYQKPYPPLTTARMQQILNLSDPVTQALPGLSKPTGRVAECRLLWQVLGLETFDKAKFATEIAAVLASKKTAVILTPEMQQLMNALFHDT